MNIPDPYTITIDEDGLSVRVEWNAHYFTDGELQMLRDHTAAIKAENDKLRRLVRDMGKALIHGNCYRWCDMPDDCDAVTTGHCPFRDRMRELVVVE